jgi:hypothetical protein
MTDIFMSYAREDASAAERLVAALGKRGWSVFWDRTIPAGKQWDDVLQWQLRRARCVVVLWSDHSVRSEWVLHEASIARHKSNLVPVQLEPALDKEPRVAAIFGSFQTVQLCGEQSQPDELIRAVEGLIGRPRKWLWWSLAAALTAFILWNAQEGIHRVNQLTHDIGREYRNEDVLRRAGVKWVNWGPFDSEENARQFQRVREAHSIDMVITNATSFAATFRPELKTFFSRPDSHMRVIFASPETPFYEEMARMTGNIWSSPGARQEDILRIERSKQELLLDTTSATQLEFKYFDTQYRMPVILIDSEHCIVTVRLPPDEGQESLRIESDESGVPTLASSSKSGVKPRLLPNVTTSCKTHFEKMWALSSNTPFSSR